MMSKLILGTVQFGLDYGINNQNGKPNITEIFKILDFARNSEIQILDTADVYGNASEIIGSYFKANGAVFKVNTKFKAGIKSIKLQLQESLSLLNLKQIDTYFFHNFKDFKINKTLLEELIILKDSDLILNIGVSIYDNQEFEEAINTTEIDVIQFPFNLLDNIQQRGQQMKFAKEKGKKLQVRSVFLQGLFFKDIKNFPKQLSPLKPYLIAIKELAHSFDMTTEKLALSYAVSQEEIDYVIFGVDNLSQLEHNVELTRTTLNTQIIDAVNQINVTEKELLYPKNWY